MNTFTRLILCLCLPLAMAGCASMREIPPPPASEVFKDAAYKPPQKPINARDLFALSPAMRSYLHSAEFSGLVQRLGPENGLVDALYKKGELRLEYDATVTRTAAETFEARMGNCLSLVLMTAAFAKEMGMQVYYQDVMMEENWSRSNGLYFASTHVNLSLSKRQTEALRSYSREERRLTIDFLRPEDMANYRSHPLEERQIVAMFMNNRAAEELSARRLDEAYWWARAAIEHSPTFATAYNTLGVIYQRSNDQAMAERAFMATLKLEPESTIAMHNLVPVLASLGRKEESLAMATRLKSLEPTPPFFYFHRGMKAMEKGEYAEAKEMFAKEVRRAPYNHEFHFWLGLAHWRLGDSGAAREQLNLALETSTTHNATELYSAKLAYLRNLTSRTRSN